MKKKAIIAIIALSLCVRVFVSVLAVNTQIFGNTRLDIGVAVSYTNAPELVSENRSTRIVDSQPNAGASDWAKNELLPAFENNLILDEMIGNWQKPANRLVAAEAVVRLLEALTGKAMSEIAEENEYDLTDCFVDTINDYANFLKQSGISNGVGDGRYAPNGIFTRVQMVTMLGRMARTFLDVDTADFPKGSTLFSDIPDWADEFVGWAGGVGITDGVGSGRFDSNGTLQNQHLGVFMWRTFAGCYKSPYKLLRTGEYLTVEQMDLLKTKALSWQSAIAIVGDFAEIVAIEPADGSEQQIYVAFRRFERDLGELVVDDKGYERMQTQKPDGVETRIFSARSGAGSGEFYVGLRFISEEVERLELFYATHSFFENDQWENVTIQQGYNLKTLSELLPEEKQFS